MVVNVEVKNAHVSVQKDIAQQTVFALQVSSSNCRAFLRDCLKEINSVPLLNI